MVAALLLLFVASVAVVLAVASVVKCETSEGTRDGEAPSLTALAHRGACPREPTLHLRCSLSFVVVVCCSRAAVI